MLLGMMLVLKASRVTDTCWILLAFLRVTDIEIEPSSPRLSAERQQLSCELPADAHVVHCLSLGRALQR